MGIERELERDRIGEEDDGVEKGWAGVGLVGSTATVGGGGEVGKKGGGEIPSIDNRNEPSRVEEIRLNPIVVVVFPFLSVFDDVPDECDSDEISLVNSPRCDCTGEVFCTKTRRPSASFDDFVIDAREKRGGTTKSGGRDVGYEEAREGGDLVRADS